jgi:hypothetical protein
MTRAHLLRVLSVSCFAFAVMLALVAAFATTPAPRFIAAIVSLVFAAFGGGVVALRVNAEGEHNE